MLNPANSDLLVLNPANLLAKVEKTAELPNQHSGVRMQHVKWRQRNPQIYGCELDLAAWLN